MSLEGDEAEARQEANRLAAIFEDAFKRAAPQIGRDVGQAMARGFRGARVGEQAFDGVVRGAQEANREARRTAGAAEDVADSFEKMGEAGRRATRKVNVDELNADVAALNERVQATRRSLTRIGAEEGLFAVIDRELNKVLSSARAFNSDLERIARDPNLLAGYEASFKNAQQTIFREVAGIQSQLRNLSNVQRLEGNRVNEEASRQAQERIQAAKLANSRLVVETQGANAQLLAETRLSGQRQIQRERIAARTRIELVRFTFRQIQILERGIAGVFRATGSIAQSAARTTQSAITRISNVLRRSNRELNDGLNSALVARERSMDRSFQRQTRIVRSSTREQTVLIDQLERRASTGVAGAITGRSRLGGLFGIGAGVGGGLVIARQLREAFDETVNLTEALNKAQQIFGDATESVTDFTDKSVENLFLTRSAALEAAANFGIFGRAAGLSGDQLSEFSTDLVQLATDLASFNNTSVDEAIRALQSGLSGEIEPLRRRFGVLLDQATLRQTAFAAGITETNRVLTQQERVLAASVEIFKQTTAAQGDAARTSEDFANSSKRAGAALTTAFAAALRGLIPIAEVITNAAFPALQALTRFIEGDVNPVARVMRDVLIGAGIALTGLLAARVAAEAIQFLGLALRGAVTPLGLLIVGVAAAGAAFRVFSQRSERFSQVVAVIRNVLGELAGRGLALATRGFDLLADVISTRIVPALEALVAAVGGTLLRGLEIAIGFIVNIAIPAFRSLASLLVGNIVPGLRATGRFLQSEVVPALQAFGGVALGVLSGVVRFLGPAIDGFDRLGGAIVNAFQTGDLSGLLGGLAAVAQGIGTVFANLGVLLYNTIRPQVERAVRFISNAFDRIDFPAIARKILEVVRLVGFVLGSIVSDPRFIQAVEAIAVAAVAVGAKFVQGFAQGVISNLPDLGRLLGGQLAFLAEEAVSFAFSNPDVIAKIVLAAFAANAVMRAFSSAGEAGAGGMARGFARGVARSPRQFAQAIDGLFPAQGDIAHAYARAGERSAQNFQRRFNRTLRDFQRLGFSTSGFVNTEVDEQALQRLRGALGQVTGQIGETRVAARLFQRRTLEAFRGVQTGVRELGRAITPGLSGSLTRARAGFSQAFTAISDGFVRLREQGKLTGANLGNAVVAGFGAAIAGQALGGGNTTIGLAGVLSSALAAGLSTGIPVIGVAVGALGLLTAAFEANRIEAEKAAEKVQAYVEILKEAEGVANSVSDIGDRVTDFFAKQDKGIRDLVVRSGIGADQFARFIIEGANSSVDALNLLGDAFDIDFTPVVAAAGGASASFQDIEDAFTDQLISNQEFNQSLRDVGLGLEDFLELIQLIGGESSALASALDESLFRKAFDPNDVELGTRAAEQFEEIINRNTVAFDEAGESAARFSGKARSATESLVDFAQDALGFVDGIDFSAAFDFDLAGTLRRYVGDFAGFGVDVSDVNERIERAVQSANAANYDNLIDETELLNEESERASRAVSLVNAAVQELQQQRTSRIRAEVEALRGRVDEATEAAERAQTAFTDFITARYASTSQSAVDQLIGQVGSIGSAIEDALLQGGVRGEAALRSAVGGFETSLAGIIQAGFDDGLRSQDQFRTLLAPLFAALDEEVGDSAARILSTKDFEFGITSRAGGPLREAIERALAGGRIEAGITTSINARAEVDRLEAMLEAQQAQLDVEVVFSPDQIRNALVAAGATAAQLSEIDPASYAAAQQSGLDGAVAETRTSAVTTPSAVPPVNIEITQSPDVKIEVRGDDTPHATASEIIRQSQAATVGRTRVAVGSIRTLSAV